jgi:hypothetical protein
MRALRKSVGKADDKRITYEDLEAFMLAGEQQQQQQQQQQQKVTAPKRARPSSGKKGRRKDKESRSSHGDDVDVPQPAAAGLGLEKCEKLVCEHMRTSSAAMLPLTELKNFVFDNDIPVDYSTFPHEKQSLIHAIGMHLHSGGSRESSRRKSFDGASSEGSNLAALGSLAGAPSLSHSPKVAEVEAVMSAFDGEDTEALAKDAKKAKKGMKRRTSQLRDAIRSRQAEVVFKQADFNNKGYLRKDGFAAMVQSLGVEATENEMKRMFKHIDKDKNKKINLEDVTSFIDETYF